MRPIAHRVSSLTCANVTCTGTGAVFRTKPSRVISRAWWSFLSASSDTYQVRVECHRRTGAHAPRCPCVTTRAHSWNGPDGQHLWTDIPCFLQKVRCPRLAAASLESKAFKCIQAVTVIDLAEVFISLESFLHSAGQTPI